MRADEELLAAWRDGDRDAGDALIGRHFASLHRFFAAKLATDAEDLVQRTLLDCVESRARVEGGDFRAFMFAVARHRLMDHLRARLRAGPAVDIGELSIADLASSATRKLARGQDEQRLREALRAISLDHQIALELAYWEGLSGREIAAVLAIDPATVRSRLARARDALRRKLGELGASAGEVETTLSQLPSD